MLGRITLSAWSLSLLILGTASAQVDPAKALVGTWEGGVDFRGAPSDPSRDPKRTLIIESVTQTGGKWAAAGAFGVGGRRLRAVQMELYAGGRNPAIRFTSGPVTVRLDLLDEKHLAGTLTTPAVGRRGSEPLPLRLEKKE